jgi:toll-interacting protein
LPDDFLRVVLNSDQIKENNDGLLAQHLQRSFYAQDFNLMDGFQEPRATQPTQTAYRGKLQVDLIEAKLNKNYGLLKMDPYVRLKVGNKIYETPSDTGSGKNPKWRKTIMWY